MSTVYEIAVLRWEQDPCFSRNMEIYHRREAGATFAAIGIEYGLTTKRIQQIYEKYKKRYPVFVAAKARAAARKKTSVFMDARLQDTDYVPDEIDTGSRHGKSFHKIGLVVRVGLQSRKTFDDYLTCLGYLTGNCESAKAFDSYYEALKFASCHQRHYPGSTFDVERVHMEWIIHQKKWCITGVLND